MQEIKKKKGEHMDSLFQKGIQIVQNVQLKISVKLHWAKVGITDESQFPFFFSEMFISQASLKLQLQISLCSF